MLQNSWKLSFKCCWLHVSVCMTAAPSGVMMAKKIENEKWMNVYAFLGTHHFYVCSVLCQNMLLDSICFFVGRQFHVIFLMMKKKQTWKPLSMFLQASIIVYLYKVCASLYADVQCSKIKAMIERWAAAFMWLKCPWISRF